MSINNYLTLILAVICLALSAYGQSGGTFVIEQSVIGTGGITDASGGQFVHSGTVGQSIAGQRATNFLSSAHAGFWNPDPRVTTAAAVTVSGRVTTRSGQGIRQVFMTLTRQDGSTQTCSTGSLGYYRFDDIEAGQSVIVSVRANRYTFAQSALVLNLTDLVEDADFVSIE